VDSRYPINPLDFDGIATYPLETRKSKVDASMFGKSMDGSENILGFIAKLPHILAADSLRSLIRAVLYARSSGSPVIWGLGGHVVKVGLGPVINDLMQSGFVTGIAMNGSAAIHDFEVALRGATSEEVEEQIGEGRFGMARETGEYMNAAIEQAVTGGIGMGEGLGRFINTGGERAISFGHRSASILAEAYSRNIPVTVHVAIGTDIIHVHPETSGKALGEATYHDFRLFCTMVKELDGGGVFLNVGSAVILPEVFLKAVSVVRNLGHRLEEFTTANLDFIQHYRPTQNVLRRPTQNSGQAIALTGHHEIMVPLIAAALKGSLEIK
jgi:deoxyhypusine synthase